MKMSSALFKIWRDLHGNNNALKSFITTKDTAKHFAQTTAIGKRDVKEKIYNFDLRYVIKRYDRNFKSIKPLVTIENEKKQFEEPVIIFPGFEGRLDSVQPLVQNLKRTIHCLQYPFEKSKNSIPEIAATIVQVLKAYALDNERMNILGHSFGGMIAMEVVRKLENEGKDIRLCLTDSTPYAVKVMTSEAFGDIQQSDEFESNLLLNIANCLEFREIILLPNVLAKCADWQEKLGTALPLIAEKTQNKVEDLEVIANGIYNVLHAIYYYNDNDIKLESETTIIRSSIKVLPFPEDYKVSKFFKTPVREFITDGHHLNMLKFPKTTNLINVAFQE